MKLGIFGGTFNPIHYGHLINAEIIRSDFNLDKIIFVPSKIPVHKDLAGNVSAVDRHAMISLAVRDVKEFEVSKIEIDREGPSYTFVTINEMKLIYPNDSLYLIVGMDSLHEIATWKEPDQFRSVSVIAMRRQVVDSRIKFDPGPFNVLYADNPLVDISSTHVRERLRSKKSVRFMIPEPVIEYINEKGLYQY